MSMERRCIHCGRKENVRYNFGHNREAEREFHSQPYDCGRCDEPDPDQDYDRALSAWASKTISDDEFYRLREEILGLPDDRIKGQPKKKSLIRRMLGL